jgi:glycerate kinase
MTPVVLIAPDKFKGSLTAGEAAHAIRRGVELAWPDAETVLLPLADGGEGTVELAVAHGATPRHAEVLGPTHARVPAAWALDATGALIETAQASGLSHIRPAPATAAEACTCGTGTLIRAALDDGADELVVSVGGTASTDGGSGILRSLGVRLLDESGVDLPCGGVALRSLHSIDLTGLHPGVADARISVATDVDNPLLGPSGAASVFSPQKGADRTTAQALEHGLRRLHHVLGTQLATDVDVPGAGAGGGVPAALLSLGARVRSGADLVMEMTGFDELARQVDLIITGEGSLDHQSLSGKLVAAIAARATCPVLAVAGRVDVADDQLRRAGISAAGAAVWHAPSVAAAMRDATTWIETTTSRLLKTVRPRETR